MDVLIIDYGMGNLGSVSRAFEECGGKVRISSDANEVRKAERILLPGVGAFGDGMRNLQRSGLIEAIREAVLKNGIPFLGICLGMQLLADIGHEGGESQGLGLISGEVKRLEPKEGKERIPHIGWNDIKVLRESPLFDQVSSGTDFYFVHSYHFIAKNPDNVLATAPYCGEFVAAVASNNIYGVQFHPEKSSVAGFQIIRNFLSDKMTRS